MWTLFAIHVSRLSLLYCYLQPCDHLLGKSLPLDPLMCDVYCVFVTFPYGVSGKVGYLIVSIPDLCLSIYFFFFICLGVLLLLLLLLLSLLLLLLLL